MLASIASECSVVHACLAHLQNLVLADSSALHYRFTPQVTTVFDKALIGGVLTLCLLDDEVQELVKGADSASNMTGKKKLQSVLNQDYLKKLLTQI